MRVKSMGVKSKSQLHDFNTEDRFHDENSNARYEEWMRGRRLLPKRGVLAKETPVQILELIKKHKWVKFTSQPNSPKTFIVKEFYVGIPVTEEKGEVEPNFSYVRGKKVSFAATKINYYYALSYRGNGFEKRMESITDAEMDQLFEKLTVARTDWEKKKVEDYKNKINTLHTNAKVWYSFITTRILPTNYNQTIENERIVLLDQLLEGKPINVGKLIGREIMDCVKRGKGSLFFPCLITDLCLQFEGEAYAGEETWPTVRPIDTSTLNRFVDSSSNKSRAPDATASQMSQVLQHLLKQQQAY